MMVFAKLKRTGVPLLRLTGSDMVGMMVVGERETYWWGGGFINGRRDGL